MCSLDMAVIAYVGSPKDTKGRAPREMKKRRGARNSGAAPGVWVEPAYRTSAAPRPVVRPVKVVVAVVLEALMRGFSKLVSRR